MKAAAEAAEKQVLDNPGNPADQDDFEDDFYDFGEDGEAEA